MNIDLTILSRAQMSKLQNLISSITSKTAIAYLVCTGLRKEKLQHRFLDQIGEPINSCYLDLLIVCQDRDCPGMHNCQTWASEFSDAHFTCVFSCYALRYARELPQGSNYYLQSAMRHGALLFQYNMFLPNKMGYTSSKELLGTMCICWSRWYGNANKFMDCALFCVAERNHDLAAFMAHQTVEHTCKAMLRIFAHSCPQTHNLQYLLKRCANFHPGILNLFPKGNPKGSGMMKKLKRSYLDCRYAASFEVSEEAAWDMVDLAARLQRLACELWHQQVEQLKSIIKPV